VRGPVLFALKVAVVLAGAVVVALLPRFMGEFRLQQFTFVAIYFVALLGLNILTGYNGQISLGHGAFMGIGAYVAAILMLGETNLEGLTLQDAPDWLPLDALRVGHLNSALALLRGLGHRRDSLRRRLAARAWTGWPSLAVDPRRRDRRRLLGRQPRAL
jgi:ABC-type branched-subunit amino acid transport system permease subunit